MCDNILTWYLIYHLLMPPDVLLGAMRNPDSQ